jgi:hypothetical protein
MVLEKLQAVMDGLAKQSSYSMRSQDITLEQIQEAETLHKIVKHCVAHGNYVRSAVKSLAVAAKDTTGNVERTYTRQQNLEANVVPGLVSRCDNMQAQITCLASENMQLKARVAQLESQVAEPPSEDDHGTAGNEQPVAMVTSDDPADQEQEPEQEQLTRPDDELPDGFSYRRVGGRYLVYKDATGASCTVQAWQQSAGTGADPFGGRSNNADHNSGNHAKVSLKAPKPFSGDRNEPRAPELAIHQLEHYFRASKLPESEWGLATGSHLTGLAEKAYNTIALNAIANSQALSWDKVRQLILTFRKSDEAVRARQELARAKQTTTVAAYNMHFDELLSKVGEDRPARFELMSWYLRGLINGETTDKNGDPFTSLEHAMKFHLTREKTHMEVHGIARDHSHTSRPSDSRAFKPRRPMLKTAQVAKASGSGYPRVQHEPLKQSSGGGRGGSSPRGGGRGGRTIGRIKSKPTIADYGGDHGFEDNLDGDCPYHRDGSHKKGQCHGYKALDKIWQAAKKQRKAPNKRV